MSNDQLRVKVFDHLKDRFEPDVVVTVDFLGNKEDKHLINNLRDLFARNYVSLYDKPTFYLRRQR